MNKNTKAISAIIIATLLSITILLSVGEAKADDQIDWTITHHGYYGGFDYSNICDHTNWQYSDDCSTLVGINATYADSQSPYKYDTVTWYISAQVGYGYTGPYTWYDQHGTELTKAPGEESYTPNYFPIYGNDFEHVTTEYDPMGEYVRTYTEEVQYSSGLASVNAISSCDFIDVSTGHHIFMETEPYQAMTASDSNNQDGESCVKVSADADVSATGAGIYDLHSNTNVHADCADDFGTYYCYITSVYHNTPFGSTQLYYDDTPGYENDLHSYDLPLYDISDAHHVIINTAPYTYPVTFKYYAYNPNYVEDYTEVESLRDIPMRVAWEEVGGDHYSHGSDLHGGGGQYYYAPSGIDDPWGDGTDSFDYAIAENWGGGSETYYNGLPLDPWTFTWGNTVDIYYSHSSAPPTYATTVNEWVTWDGYNFELWDSYYVYEPANWNYLDFGANFVKALNSYDYTWHYDNPDWYNLGTGTTLDVGYWWSGGMSPMNQNQSSLTNFGNQTSMNSASPISSMPTDSGFLAPAMPTDNFTIPVPNPYTYDPSTNTSIPVRNP